MNENIDWNGLILKFVNYCNSVGVQVCFKRGCEDQYDSDYQTIQINNQRIKKNQFFILLHEYGHHQIFQNKRLNKKFSSIAERDVGNTLSEQVLAIEEEFLAWHFGEEAAHNLGIDLSIHETYQTLKAKCLKSHIQSYKKVTNNKEEYI